MRQKETLAAEAARNERLVQIIKELHRASEQFADHLLQLRFQASPLQFVSSDCDSSRPALPIDEDGALVSHYAYVTGLQLSIVRCRAARKITAAGYCGPS